MNLRRPANVAVVILAAVAAPVDALLIDVHAWSAQVGTDVGGIVTAFVAAWHGGQLLANTAPGLHTRPRARGYQPGDHNMPGKVDTPATWAP